MLGTTEHMVPTNHGRDVRLLWAEPKNDAGLGGCRLLISCHGLFGGAVGKKNRSLSGICLEKGIGFCSFDFSGHGKTGGDIGTMSLSILHDDLAAVVKWVLARGFAPNEIMLVASSMGARVAWYFITKQDAEFHSFVMYAPLLNPINSTLAKNAATQETAFFQSIREFDAYAPDVVARLSCPIRIIHGTQDELLPVADSDRLVRLLVEQGKHVQFDIVAADHQFSTDEQRSVLVDLTFDWMEAARK